MTNLFTELQRLQKSHAATESHAAESLKNILGSFKKARAAERAERICLEKAHASRVDFAMRHIVDYHDVMKTMQHVMVADEVIVEIMRSDRSAEVAYYLAQNVTAFEAIKKLTGRELTFEIGRITGIISGQKLRVKMGRLQVN